MLRSPLLTAATTLVAALLLTSCAPTYDQATEQSLRRQVVAASQASAAGDWQGALQSLDAMASELESARANGKVDDERFESIVAAMELVRLDLEAAITAAEDEAERQRLLDEQARLQEQITQLQAPDGNEGDGGAGTGGETGDGDKGKDKDEGEGKDGKDEGKD